ncbi:facilitated trehalose transporter Tret1-like [Anticarsia gemmatalis]|uniref:facilitated trehalose transporter Tret1-like n=1 Tax=Anticarsia gemmatalis TaxID=129554 RepID=UPI003F76B895
MDEQNTSTVDPEASPVHNGESMEHPEPRFNGHPKILQRLETVPDIKRDTSGITTQYIATGIVNLGAFAAGVCVAWSSTALPLLTKVQLEPVSPTRDAIIVETSTPTLITSSHTKFGLSTAEASWAASLLCLGAVWGAVPAGLISEYFGRKKTLLYLALPLVVSWILVASSPNVYGLYVGRFVGGVAVGAFSVGIPPYVEDIAEKQLLPTMANFYHVHFSCGVLFGYIIGLVGSMSWLSILCASVPTAFFVAFIFLPESPAYLMSQGKFHEAKAALRYFRGIDNDIDSELKALREHLRNSARNRVTFKQLLTTRSTVKALVVSFGLMIFQQLSGIYPILFYAHRIFELFAISLSSPGATIILGFCFVSSTYFSTMLLKVIRRRVLLMVSFIVMALNLGCLSIYYHLQASNKSLEQTWVPLFSICLLVSFYAAGVGPIPWLMLREIFPPNVVRRATAITAGFHWFLAFIVTKIFQNLEDMVKIGWTLSHFAIACLVATIFVYFFVPETKGRTLQEIQNEFEGIHKKRKHRHVIEVESISEP